MSTIGAGTSKYTVASVMERLFIQWLTPPDDQYAQVALGADITDTTVTTITLGEFTIAEDELLLRQGSLLEAGQELMRVVSYDSISKEVEVERGDYGTPTSTHTRPLLLNLNPPYARATVFEAVADNIITLYPSLSTTNQELISNVTTRVYPIADDLAVSVLSVQPGDFTSTIDIHGEIVDFHPMVGGRALITNLAGGTVWLRYKRRMGKATNETDELKDLGVDERWVNVVMAGAAADLMAGRDIPAAHTEWVKSVLEAENIRVGTRMSIGGGLRQYRGLLLDEFMKEMKAEYKPKVRMRMAGQQHT